MGDATDADAIIRLETTVSPETLGPHDWLAWARRVEGIRDAPGCPLYAFETVRSKRRASYMRVRRLRVRQAGGADAARPVAWAYQEVVRYRVHTWRSTWGTLHPATWRRALRLVSAVSGEPLTREQEARVFAQDWLNEPVPEARP